METGGVLDRLFNAQGPDWLFPIFDRMMLRFMESPSLIQYMKDSGIVPKHKSYVIQLVFSKLPDEVIPEVHRIIAVGTVHTYEYEINGQAYHGFEVDVPKESVEQDTDDEPENQPGITDAPSTNVQRVG